MIEMSCLLKSSLFLLFKSFIDLRRLIFIVARNLTVENGLSDSFDSQSTAKCFVINSYF